VLFSGETTMGKTYKDRLERLDDIKHCLMDDRKFYLSRKDWPQVKVLTDALKKHQEQVARVIHMAARESSDSFKSA
jgi:hypothetical protein